MTAQVCAAGDARVCVAVSGRVRAHACGLLPSALQSRKCVYPVRVTDGDLLSRVMSELAPITLGRDEFTIDLSLFHFIYFLPRVPHHGMFRLGLRTVSCQDGFRGSFHLEGCVTDGYEEFTPIRGPSDSWAFSATSSDKFVSMERFPYLRSPSNQCPWRS